MRRVTAATFAFVVAPSAYAEDFELKPLAEARARYEDVEQDELLRKARALTVRVRGGIEASAGAFSLLAEGQGTLAVSHAYFDGLRGDARRPQVSDPENVALYRVQLRYARPGLALTAGRQKIILDDERFVGAANFRQNGQSFDAVRIEWTPLAALKADLSYAWSDRTIWGISGAGARQQAVSGANVFANLSYRVPLGTLTGFAYLVDQDEAAVLNYRQSSQTYGVRFAGKRPLAKSTTLSFQASYARQADYHRNPNRYRASYYLVDAGIDRGRARLGAGYEVLGADRGTALTSFQTPLSSLFKFQGWADKFLTTPADGIRDAYGSAGYALPSGTRPGTVTLQAVYHRFHSDRNVRLYGDEWDLLASAKVGRTTLSARYADYRAKGFLTGTRKLWLTADWAF